MSRPFRVLTQTCLVCLSAVPFLTVAPGVLDAHRAHQGEQPAAPPVSSAPSLGPRVTDLRLPFLSSHPNPTH